MSISDISEIDESTGGWDRTLLNISSWMTEPICRASELFYRTIAPLAPSKFDFCSTKTKEVGVRSLIVGGAIASGCLISLAPIAILSAMAVWGVASKVFRSVGFALQKNGYTHVRGEAAEETANGRISAMTYNVGGIAGGMSYDHCGLPHWRDRIDGIEANVRSAIPSRNPQAKPQVPRVLVFQEIYDTALAEEIIKRFSKDYAHIFIHLGSNTMGSVGGCIMLTNLAVESFKSTSFVNNTWKINQTFASLKVKASPQDKEPCAAFIGTHLIWNSKEGRKVQIDQIKKSIQNDKSNIPTVLLGDFNVNLKNGPESPVLLDDFTASYTGDEPTCTNGLVDQWSKGAKGVLSGEYVDNILLAKGKGGHLSKSHLVNSFDSEKLDTAHSQSDHNAVVGELTY